MKIKEILHNNIKNHGKIENKKEMEEFVEKLGLKYKDNQALQSKLQQEGMKNTNISGPYLNPLNTSIKKFVSEILASK